MTIKLVNFCYRNLRVNKVHLVRSRMQPFWLSRNNVRRPTGYAKDATAFVETAWDREQLEANGYRVILLQPGVNCQDVRDEYHAVICLDGRVTCM
jgi:hypothetical protein